MFVNFIQGVWHGSTTTLYKRQEDSARVGLNRWLTAANQIGSTTGAIEIFKRVLIANSTPLSKKISVLLTCVAVLTPIVSNTLCAKIDIAKQPRLKRNLIFINNHIGSLCQIAVLTSSVALITLGQPLFGSTVLAFVILGYIQRRCWMPLLLNNGINGIGFIGSNISRIVFGNFLHKASAVLEIINTLSQQILKIKKHFFQSKVISSPSIDLKITTLIQGTWLKTNLRNIRIDPHHFKKTAQLPPPPNVNIATLKDLFDNIDLTDTKFLNILTNAVMKDDHWKENYADKQSRKDLIKYIQTGLVNYINNVKNRTISTGELTDYRSLECRSKHIAHQLATKDKTDQLINILNLSLASYYCPAAYTTRVTEVYYSVCNSFEEDTLESKIDQCLSAQRTSLFQRFLYEMYINNPDLPSIFKSISDPTDTHLYHQYTNILADHFHLSDTENASLDSLSYLDTFNKKLISHSYKRLTEEFTKKYTPVAICEALYEANENKQISYEFFETWFAETYALERKNDSPRQTDEPEKDYEERIREESFDWVRDNVIDLYSGEIKIEFMYYLLIKMRILKLVN